MPIPPGMPSSPEESREQLRRAQAADDLLWRGSERTGKRGRVPGVERRRPGDEDGVDGGRPLPAGQWAAVTVPTMVMCGAEKESPAFFHHAAAAVAAALPDARLVVRRGLGHSKKLDAKAIAATLIEFLTGLAPGSGNNDETPARRTGGHDD